MVAMATQRVCVREEQSIQPRFRVPKWAPSRPKTKPPRMKQERERATAWVGSVSGGVEGC